MKRVCHTAAAMSEDRPTTRTPRTGRRPGVSGSREAILEAARKLFADRGYVGTSLRAIATEAGVDAALIVHFFGTKAGLLTEAISWPFDPEVEMARIGAAGARPGRRGAARLVVRTWDREGDRDAILTLLRAAMVEPAAAELMRAFIEDELFPPLMRRLDVARRRAAREPRVVAADRHGHRPLRAAPAAAGEHERGRGRGLDRARVAALPGGR